MSIITKKLKSMLRKSMLRLELFYTNYFLPIFPKSTEFFLTVLGIDNFLI